MSAAAAKVRLREYEIVYVLSQTADNAEAERVNAKVTEVVSSFGGKLLKLDNWGRRKLAYPIKRNARGIFVYVRYVAQPGVVAELERNLRISDSILRFQSSLINAEIEGEVTVDPEDVKFAPVLPAEPEEELSYEQRLGLVPSARKKEQQEDELDALGDEMDDVPDLNAEPGSRGAP